jgi:hypothetical protein
MPGPFDFQITSCDCIPVRRDTFKSFLMLCKHYISNTKCFILSHLHKLIQIVQQIHVYMVCAATVWLDTDVHVRRDITVVCVILTCITQTTVISRLACTSVSSHTISTYMYHTDYRDIPSDMYICGMCSNSVTGYRCTCQTGYHGSLCDTCKY